jgi:hypothetical protein
MRGTTRYMAMIPALAIGLATLAACGKAAAPAAGPTTPPATERTFEEDEWTIVTPAGWTREVVTRTVDAKKAVRYQDADGSYVTVAIDPLGSDFGYDALWRYRVTGDGFEIADRYECAGKDDESCSDDDDRYDGYALWKNGAEPPKVGGHTWYFIFGNAKTTTVEPDSFEEILESIRVTA